MTQLSLSYCSSMLQLCREPKLLVPKAGLEPARLSTPDFESGTSANSIIRAYNALMHSYICGITGFVSVRIPEPFIIFCTGEEINQP